MKLKDHFETVDGSRPEAVPLASAVGQALPVFAFSILEGGDTFEAVNGRPPPEGPSRAAAYWSTHVEVAAHGAPPAQVERVQRDLVRVLSGNLQLLARLEKARPLTFDLVPPRRAMFQYGYPRSASPTTAGLFWDHPSWPRARIALRQDRLDDIPQLVFHELAHAVHYLAFTDDERKRIYRLLLPTYGNRASADEAFAIYSEREFLPDFSEKDLKARGVYGMARNRWSEDHLFTRFIRYLYFPYKPLAGPRVR